MKSVLLISWMICLSAVVSAQDFASYFLEKCQPDSNLECISISPKMIEEILKIEVDDTEDGVLDIISNLKSMQMLKADKNGEEYFEEALDILDKNAERFEPFLSFEDSSANCRIMVRRKRKKEIIELVMLVNENSKFLVVNFTGHMNDKFITRLAGSMNLKRS